MAIARKPNSKPKPPVTDDAADAFIAGAAKPAAPAIPGARRQSGPQMGKTGWGDWHSDDFRHAWSKRALT